MIDIFVYVGFVLVAIACLIVGFLYGFRAGYNECIKDMEEEGYVFEEELEPEQVPRRYMTIEKSGGIFYAYDKETNEFMAQGNDEQELYANLVDRFPEFAGATFKMSKLEKRED